MTQVQLTDLEWEFIESYLPIGGYGPYPDRLRQQFEGVMWRFRTGGQWREMSAEFGAWSTVHNRFRQWRDAGVFEALQRRPHVGCVCGTRLGESVGETGDDLHGCLLAKVGPPRVLVAGRGTVDRPPAWQDVGVLGDADRAARALHAVDDRVKT